MSSAELDYARVRQRAMQSLFDTFDALCEGTVVVDQDARIAWINERYAARFGIRAPAEVIGRPVEAVIPTSLMREVVRSGKPILLDIMEVDGESFVVTRIPLKDDDGQVIGAVGLALFDRLQPLQHLYARLHRLNQELARTREHLAQERRSKYSFSNYIGASPAATEVKRQARRAALLDATVLLLGETGTGKELMAHAIHASSARAAGPFVGINVAAVPDTLLEAEFFGAAPGAYTGADRRARPGKFELAHGGTLFLDEIGDMPLATQSKLLRVLQEQEVEPLGSNKVIRIDVRVIAATSRDLKKEVEAGRFRADLYYRLNVLTLTLPPLRQRPEDLEALCEHLLEQIAARTRMPLRVLRPEALALLQRCPWPGNLRELRNVLEQACMLAEHAELTAADFAGIVDAPPAASAPAGARPAPSATPGSEAIPRHAEALAEFERDLIRRALAASAGKVPLAASRLGIGRATLYKKIAELGITRPGDPASA